MQRRGQASTTHLVHRQPGGRRPTEIQAIDMDEVWAEQQVEHPHWLRLYSAIVQAHVQAELQAPPPPTRDGEPAPMADFEIDYEALATEADRAYARFAARLRGQRSRG